MIDQDNVVHNCEVEEKNTHCKMKGYHRNMNKKFERESHPTIPNADIPVGVVAG